MESRWPDGFYIRGWHLSDLPKKAFFIHNMKASYLFLVQDADQSMKIWATPFDSRKGYEIGQLRDGEVILNEFGNAIGR